MVEDGTFDVCRGVISPGESFNYNGLYYRNAFRVSGGDVLLHSVGFFGPTEKKIVKYRVTLDVETPTFALPYPSYSCCGGQSQKSGRTFSVIKEKVTAEQNKMFYVSFTPILIRPEDGYVQISFTLQPEQAEENEGKRYSITSKPNFMGRMKPGKQEHEVSVGFRHFSFMSGSCQMPILRFSLP